ncbi:hypothetical protein QQF64_032634 [Cirrhinus molitorella]|uniref:Uncharacterized protein n=1 Tax=Cirrhinus molitorella TaxID=172907 RepID=A0ABR3N083_9TELE
MNIPHNGACKSIRNEPANVSRRCHCRCMIATCSPPGIDACRPASRPVHPFVSCSDVTNYSCRTIGNVSCDRWTVIAQLSTAHEDVSVEQQNIFDCCENIMKKSLFARIVTSPQVPTVL